MSVRQRLLQSVDNLTEDYKDSADDDDSDDNANADLTQVADADELLCKRKFKQLTKDMHEYYRSHTTSDFRVGIGTFCAAKYVREERWCRVRVTSVDADNVGVLYIDNGKTGTADVSSVRSHYRRSLLHCRFKQWHVDSMELSTLIA